MLFVHKWWRKRPYAFYKCCRAMQDLQIWYSATCPLRFKNLEKRPFKQGQAKFERGRPRPRARHRASRTDPRRGLAEHARRGRLRSAGPCAVGRPCEPPSRPSPWSPRATSAQAASRRPCRSANHAPPYAAHVVPPCCIRAATTVVVLRTKASSTAIKEPELSLLRAYISPPLVCSAVVRH
jgi:hypothetical protein